MARAASAASEKSEPPIHNLLRPKNGLDNAVHFIYRYATSRNYIVSSPLPTIVPKVPPRFIPHIYSEDEVRRLLDATTSYPQTHILLEPHTFRAVLLLLYGAGLRISEALALTMADVDLLARQFVIQKTKFYKSRIVPFGNDLNEGMMRYAKRRHKAGHSTAPNAPFFAGRTGDRLEIPTVQQAFRRLRLHAGIRREDGARYQPRIHDLRHAFAVEWVVGVVQSRRRRPDAAAKALDLPWPHQSQFDPALSNNDAGTSAGSLPSL